MYSYIRVSPYMSPYTHTQFSFTYTENKEIFKITTFLKIKIYELFQALILLLHFRFSSPGLRLLCVCMCVCMLFLSTA